MNISVTLCCHACGTEIEEITDVECEREFMHVASHRHGKCPVCIAPMVCVCEGAPPQEHAGVH